MAELYKSVSAGVGEFIQSWLVPSAIAVAVFAFLVFPSIDDQGIFADIAKFSEGGKAATAGFSAILLAFVLAAVSTPVYRLLEGYHWVPNRTDRLTDYTTRWNELRDQTNAPQSVALSNVREELDRFPRSERNLMPTRLGNQLRSGETYGTDQYSLDTAILWPQLMAASDEVTRQTLTETRATMDFFIGLWTLAPLLALTSVFAAAYGSNWLLLLGLLFLPVGWIAYEGAVSASAPYAGALRGLVDVSRVALADQLGLELPNKLAAERELWEAVSGYASWGPDYNNSDEWIAIIDRHRKAGNGPNY
jgi:hypothetical protein